MAFEVEAILRFENYPPMKEDLEEAFDCEVIEWIETET